VRAIGLDVHRDFCEVAISEAGEVRSPGRIDTKPEVLELFARSLDRKDQVALEVTGNARAAWPSVKQLPREAWTDERVRRVREAAKDNIEVREASINDGGWERAPALIERHLKSLGLETGESPANNDDIPF
jgi:hypothetical protein